MPYAYVQPEEAFEIRIQCTEEEIQKHCDAAPENDRRDFDDRGGLQIPVYHVYKGHNFPDPLTFWYTLDINESEDNEFDIRMMPNFPMKHDPNNPCYGMSCNDHAVILQAAINKGLVIVDGCTIDIMENNN
jgi:hypothetical protein